MTIEEFRIGAAPYIERLDAFVQKHSLVAKVAPDHICYKCGSKESFQAMREMFEQHSHYVYQAIISGRRIAYIKLQVPIESALGQIWFIELSDQKPDGSQKDSYDHVEVYGTSISYADMVGVLKRAGEPVMHIERPHHTTDDIDIGLGFSFRCSPGPLIEKIKIEL